MTVKAPEPRLEGFRRARAEAMMEGRIAALFRRLPQLCGFAIDQMLRPVEIAVHTWPGHVVEDEVYQDVVAALANLVAERPEAAELLRGRTFARTLQ